MKCCDITPGMLRHPVTIERKTTSPDGSGGVTVTWTEVHQARAHMKDASGTERLFAERLNAEVKVKATIRYKADITEVDRLKFRGRVYQIRHIENVEYRNRWLVLSLDGGVAT